MDLTIYEYEFEKINKLRKGYTISKINKAY